ncbi:uncharacterized protein AB675_6302 [Cyphellophora attinorum]|uniref:Uncharacterized protein n=1 Tax=Cyphellophora attinorum TaxID=1664694 RepID=A0A0N0NQB6_9EURO|nr:uncharacterized protein AB675_6302 [Phialophora attinorum]KPI43718.1 hypothetical protein AB675_6302 [Phialophora attinorum]
MATTPPLSQGKPTPSPTLKAVDRAPLTPPPEPATDSSTVGLCIAHYNEDLTWLQPFASNTVVYSKGPKAPSPRTFSRTVPLPNIGRETHTYLTHITQNYASLPPVTLFLQGDIHSVNEGTPAHTDLTLSELVSQAAELAPGAVLPIGLLHKFSSWDAIPYKPDWVRRRGATLVRSKYTPGQFWTDVLFPQSKLSSSTSSSISGSDSSSADSAAIPDSVTEDSRASSTSSPAQPASASATGGLPQEVRFVQGACFAVTREAIHRRPHEWWERMLKWFKELNEMNPEEGHYMERFWWAVFDEEVAVLR